MKRAIAGAALCAWVTGAGAGMANPVEQACNASDRPASASLCSCIGQVADMTLSPRDQRRAAKFFGDPAAAQDVRTSDSAANTAFWERYRAFGATAESFCAG